MDGASEQPPASPSKMARLRAAEAAVAALRGRRRAASDTAAITAPSVTTAPAITTANTSSATTVIAFGTTATTREPLLYDFLAVAPTIEHSACKCRR